MKDRHMHILHLCRSHQAEMELAPMGSVEKAGVFYSLDEIDEAFDEFVHMPIHGTDLHGSDLVEFRAPGTLAYATIDANDEVSKEYGGDGRCHRLFIQVNCVGDPEECRARITGEALQSLVMKLVDGSLPPEVAERMISEAPPEVLKAIEAARAMKALSDLFDNLMPNEDDEAPRLPPTMGLPVNFGHGVVNEPMSGFDDDDPFSDFDFGGFDQPTDKKRLN